MTTGTMATQNAHLGRNVKRLREILGIKQEALAIELGGDWNQKKISALETKEYIEADLLAQVANALKVPVDAIENFTEEAPINIIASTFTDSAVANKYSDNSTCNFRCNFNPIEKIVELYDALLKSEKEKTALLEKMLHEQKK